MLYYINSTMCYNKAIQFMDVSADADIHIENAPKRTAFRFVVSSRHCYYLQLSGFDNVVYEEVYCFM